jgi:hypothetical protein
LASGLLAAAYTAGNAQSAPAGQPQIEVSVTGPEEIKTVPAAPVQPAPGPVEKPRPRPPAAAPRQPLIEMPPLINIVHPGVSGCTTCAGSHLGLVSNDNVKQIGGEVTPPDQGLAANNDKILEAVNCVLRVTSSTGILLAGPVGTEAFLGKSCLQFSDPQVFFNPLVNRWFFTGIVSTSPTFIPGQLVILVSKSANPNPLNSTNWRIGGTLSFGKVVPDYPKSGFNKDVFVITADLFSSPTNFVKAAVVALSIKDLVSGVSPHIAAFAVPISFVVQPSLPACSAPVGGKANCEPSVTAAGGVEYLLSAQNIFDGKSQNIRVFALSNTGLINAAPSALRLKTKDFPANAGGNPGYGTTVPSPNPGPVGPYCKSQGYFLPPPIDGNYQAFQASVQQASGNLFGALNFGVLDAAKLPVDVLLWFKLKPTVDGLGNVTSVTGTQGYIVPPTGYSLSYPAFGLHKAGDGVLGMTISNRSATALGGFPSAAFIKFNRAAPVGNILVSGAGVQPADDFSGCPSPPGAEEGIARWGDYGAAVVDAASGKFFIANEYIPKKSIANPLTTSTNWGTFVTSQ